MDMRRLIGLALVSACSVWAQVDARLGPLHETLKILHAQTGVSALNRGAGPKLTLAKHQLRDWIELQLGEVENPGDEVKASERISNALEKVSVSRPKDYDRNFLGSLGGVSLQWESGLLIVITRVGIVCEHDESVYGYKRIDSKWQRIWESEQNDYRNYTPQHINAVHVWQSYKDGRQVRPTYILTLGNEWGCASSWHRVYYRIWRVDSSGPKNLVDQSADAYLRAETYIVGSIVDSPMHSDGSVDALMEFTQRSVDGREGTREAVRHFVIEGDRVRRVDPVALSPRNFVDEWMTRPWSESREWSSTPNLWKWHKRLHVKSVSGDFLGDTMHCQTPDLWQVGFEPSDAKPDVYFLIRWTPPYRFVLADISDKPWPRCMQPDQEADAWRTLFSTQEWRR